MMYSEEDLKALDKHYKKISSDFSTVIDYQFISLSNELAKEFLKHGFLRRVGILRRSIEKIYEICPPSNKKALSADDAYDLTINIQAFILNIFGALDNLAHIWVKEKEIKGKEGKKLGRLKIGFSVKCTEVRESFSKDFQAYLNSNEFKTWYKYIEEFRHALAHRIPLYVPPSSITSEEDALKLKEMWDQFYFASTEDNFEKKNNA